MVEVFINPSVLSYTLIDNILNLKQVITAVRHG
jgi:hypothetical protein